jgi:SAM-dependent methyltransferase
MTMDMRQGEENKPRHCPVCTAYDPELLFSQRFQAIPGVSLLRGYDVVACKCCGCTYADHIPPNEAFEAYYRESSKYEHPHRAGQEHAEERARLENLASWVASRVERSSSILDVGCGTGRLIRALRDLSFSNVQGLDPSAACCENARALSGCQVLHSAITARPAGFPLCDVAILSAVLEHVPHVADCLHDVTTWLAPASMIVVEVPDAGAFPAVRNAPFQEFSVEHINFFSAHSLQNLFRSLGCDVVAVDETECPVGPAATGRVVRVIARLNDQKILPVFEPHSREAVRHYVEKCRLDDTRMVEVLARQRQEGQPVHIWGIGTLCQRLAANGGLSGLPIASFVDSNPHVHGQRFGDIAIRSPDELPDDGSPVIIASWQFAPEIRKMIAARSLSPRRVIDLFSTD